MLWLHGIKAAHTSTSSCSSIVCSGYLLERAVDWRDLTAATHCRRPVTATCHVIGACDVISNVSTRRIAAQCRRDSTVVVVSGSTTTPNLVQDGMYKITLLRICLLRLIYIRSNDTLQSKNYDMLVAFVFHHTELLKS